MFKLVLAWVPLAVAVVLAYLTIRHPRGTVFTITGDTFLEELLGDVTAQRVHMAMASLCTALAVLLALRVLNF